MAPRGRQTDCFRLHSIGTNIPTLSRSFFFSLLFTYSIYTTRQAVSVCVGLYSTTSQKKSFFFFFFLK